MRRVRGRDARAARRNPAVAAAAANCVTDEATVRCPAGDVGAVVRACEAAVARAGYAVSRVHRATGDGDAARPDRAEAVFVVGGLVCAACPPRIVRALGLTAGVLEVAVEVLLERVRVAYDPARLGAQDIARKLRKLGYEAEVAGAASASDRALAGEKARRLAREAEVRRYGREALLALVLALPIFVVVMLLKPYGPRGVVLALEANVLGSRRRYLAAEALGSLLLATPISSGSGRGSTRARSRRCGGARQRWTRSWRWARRRRTGTRATPWARRRTTGPAAGATARARWTGTASTATTTSRRPRC